MQADAMLGKSSVGWEKKVPELPLDAIKRNSLPKCNTRVAVHKPYRIPGASLLPSGGKNNEQQISIQT